MIDAGSASLGTGGRLSGSCNAFNVLAIPKRWGRPPEHAWLLHPSGPNPKLPPNHPAGSASARGPFDASSLLASVDQILPTALRQQIKPLLQLAFFLGRRKMLNVREKSVQGNCTREGT